MRLGWGIGAKANFCEPISWSRLAKGAKRANFRPIPPLGVIGPELAVKVAKVATFLPIPPGVLAATGRGRAIRFIQTDTPPCKATARNAKK